MVRYADRGLVKNGVVSKLFSQLYLTFALTIGLWGVVLFFIPHILDTESNKVNLLTSLCMGQLQE